MNARLVATAMVALAACGEALAPADYRGEPIYKIEGHISTLEALPEELQDTELAISMFWAPEVGDSAADLALVEQPSVTTKVEFPSTFVLRVFEPPSEAHFGSEDVDWVLGLLLVYLDLASNGRYEKEAGDQIIGGTVMKGLLYARTDLDAADSPTGEATAAGFSVVDLPVAETSCVPRPAPSGAPRRPPPRPPNFRCTDTRQCPPRTLCDAIDHVCVPNDPFELRVSVRFDLRRPFCHY